MIRLAVRVAREHAEVVCAEMLALSPGGLEERDVDDRTVELVIYGAAGELPDLPRVRAAAGRAPVEVSTSEVPDDWERRWREWHRPLDVGPLRVRQPWAPRRPGALDVAIEPGGTFGTGAHPSTRLTLELLVTVPARGALADWGCGSGILALSAARLGFDPVLACDVEPAAVAATLAAAAANAIPGREAPRGGSFDAAEPSEPGSQDAGESEPESSTAAGPRSSGATGIVAGRIDLRRAPGPRAPTVTANLHLPLLLELAGLMTRPPERLIASGLLADEVGQAEAAFGRHGLTPAARRDEDGWSAILLAR